MLKRLAGRLEVLGVKVVSLLSSTLATYISTDLFPPPPPPLMSPQPSLIRIFVVLNESSHATGCAWLHATKQSSPQHANQSAKPAAQRRLCVLRAFEFGYPLHSPATVGNLTHSSCSLKSLCSCYCCYYCCCLR